MIRLVIMKKGGESGEIAINPELITYIRQTPGQFTDIYFGEHRIAVEGSFRQVVDRLSGADTGQHAGKAWLTSSRP
ncbi:MAG: hypothetical protein ACXW2T_02430 [Allosphingosinicella sp.]